MHRSPIRSLDVDLGMIPWLLKLATQMLACGLNMPEPLVHHTGVFVFAAFETGIGKSLCPNRLLRYLRKRRRGSGR